jgi:hypothetical protein
MPTTKPKSRIPAKSATRTKTIVLPFSPTVPARPFLDPQIIDPQFIAPRITDHHAATRAADSRSAVIAAIQKTYAKPAKQSPSNVLGNPTESLQTFTLPDLA